MLNITYYKVINKALRRKLKRSFILDNQSWMCSQLNGERTLTGAAVAFSKAGYVIGWSSVQHDSNDNTMFINTFVSRRHRHKGLASILIKKCIEENRGKYSCIANRGGAWIGIDVTVANRAKIRKMIDGKV